MKSLEPAFSAALRRLPGGCFAKMPRSQAMTAIPPQTSLTNMCTYFHPWPKHRSMFIIYGSRHASTTAQPVEQNTKTQVMDVSEKNSGTYSMDGIYGGINAAGVNGAEGQTGGEKPKAAAAAKPLGLAGVRRRFERGQKLSMVTAYDFPSGRFARQAGVELVLVGDSLGNCRLGLSDTVGVTMEDMLRATTAVRRGVDAPGPATSPKPLVIGDMPFGSYLTMEDALRNAAAFRVAGADVVKLEGGGHLAPVVKALTNAGIAVMSHIGLEPQRALLQGGFRLQGTSASSAMELVSDAKELNTAGAVLLVVEMVPEEVGTAVQASVSCPVIGIGAGGKVAGQVLVCDDMLGMHGRPPSFAKMFFDVGRASAEAYENYVKEVRSGQFPGDKYSRHMPQEELDKLQQLLPQVPLQNPAQEPSETPAVNGHTATPSRSQGTGGSFGFELLQGRLLPVQRHAVGTSVRRTAGARGISQVSLDREVGSGRAELQRLSSNAELIAWRQRVAEQGRRVAFVPTMGNLHEGHLELIDAALQRGDEAIVSIFVNPSQFASHEDLDTYPRTLEEDMQKLRERGATALFTPLAKELYPTGSPGGTMVVPHFVEGKSEAADRPHFFSGVATVCLKFFNLLQPDVAIFGQKDAMQCVVIARMLEDLMLDHRIALHVVPTSREFDGVARSSRNSYLSPKMRQKAPAIYKALCAATTATGATPGSVRASVRGDLERQELEVSYISVADTRFMNEKADEAELSNSVVSICCIMKEEGHRTCRLLDNVLVPAR